jgi:hypothetical protein
MSFEEPQQRPVKIVRIPRQHALLALQRRRVTDDPFEGLACDAHRFRFARHARSFFRREGRRLGDRPPDDASTASTEVS